MKNCPDLLVVRRQNCKVKQVNDRNEGGYDRAINGTALDVHYSATLRTGGILSPGPLFRLVRLRRIGCPPEVQIANLE